MTNRDLAEKIYEDLNKRGADLGNASIGIIRKTLDDNGVKNCSIPDVVHQREQFKSMVFDMANKLAIEGNSDESVMMHKIHNRL